MVDEAGEVAVLALPDLVWWFVVEGFAVGEVVIVVEKVVIVQVVRVRVGCGKVTPRFERLHYVGVS